jgi:uncharacterized SAM-binding protein YcdF (DUF218 family)
LRRRRVVLLAAACVVALVILTHAVWLAALGNFLVSAEAPQQADVALVLAGDYRGNRIITGAELARAGFVKKVLVSGPMESYGVNEAHLAIRYIVSQGYPAEYFEPVILRAFSTDEEARKFRAEFERRGIRSLLLVTSNYHTRRAGSIYRRIMPRDITVRVIAAPDPYFQPATWWHTREGQKTWFFEATKTIAGWLGL